MKHDSEMTMKKLILIGLAIFLFTTVCKVSTSQVVTVSSFIDAEGSILGKMIVQLLKENGIPVIDRTELGTPDILRIAIINNEIDIYVDYTGSGQFYYQSEDPSPWSDPQKGYQLIRKLDLEHQNLYWLTPAPVNNTESLAITGDFAKDNHIYDLPALAAYINSGGKIKLICSQSYADSPLGLPGLEKAYGFKLRSDQMILLSSGNTAEMVRALVNGLNDINISLVYGTDGALDELDLLVLKDSLKVPPVYLPAPVIRGEVLDRYKEIPGILAPVFESFTLEILQNLNARVAFKGESPNEVAQTYLRENKFSYGKN
jgi:osmoprotectant transport system substrate-binding protein